MATISGDFSTNLISHWKLDEASGTREDIHGSNDLTANGTGGVGAATGKINDGADLELSDSDYLSIADASQTGLDISGDMTMSFWVKFESLPDYGMCVSKFGSSSNQRSYRFGQSGTTAIFQNHHTGSAANTVTWAISPSLSTWYHYMLVYTASGGSAELFIDGTSQTSKSGLSTSMFNGTSPFEIGRSNSPSEYYLDGVIDEVSIWSTALTSGNVTTIYNSGSGIPYSAAAGATPMMMLMGVG